METENQPTEWVSDVPAHKIFVTNTDQRISMRAINIDTGAQFGPQSVFSGVNPSIIAEHIQKGVKLSEVTDNSITVRFEFYIHPIELLLNPNSAIERENNLLKIKVEKLQDQLKVQEEEQLKPLQTEVQNLKNQVGKTFYLKTSVDDWKHYSDLGIQVKVDFSHLNLRNQPHVQVSLNGSGCHWETTGSNSIYALTPQSFEIYVKSTRFALNPQIAKQYGWYLTYVIHSMDD